MQNIIEQPKTDLLQTAEESIEFILNGKKVNYEEGQFNLKAGNGEVIANQDYKSDF